MEKGYIQIYTGDGKGKTTAALGLGLRAVGNGMKVLLIQFLKGTQTGELTSVQAFNGAFEVKRIGEHKKFFWTLTQEEKMEYRRQVQMEIESIDIHVQYGDYDLIILDEIFGALSNEVIFEEQVLYWLESKSPNIELILTGRGAPSSIIERADLVTEMRPIRHYYSQGIQSRQGIEY